MPINKKYPIKQVVDAAKYYQKKNGRRVSFEYVLLGDFNDRDEDANQIAKLLNGIICHVNLIQLNIHSSCGYGKSQRLQQFKAILQRNSIEVSVRRSAGSDIAAACGQLAG